MNATKPVARILLLAMVVFTPGMLATAEIVHFADPAVEAAVREELGRPSPMLLTSSHLLDLRKLDVWLSDAESLDGMEYALNLRVMVTPYNRISDLTPLRGLTDLHWLVLHSNHVEDVSPLSSLTTLERLYLGANDITDISSLSSLTELRILELDDNRIEDISALAHMPKLESLNAGENRISDITPLGSPRGLSVLYLNDNLIEDISPLLTSATTGRLRYLDLRGNPLNEEAYTTHLPFIEANNPDATILYDPVPEPVALSTMLMSALMLLRRKKPHAVRNPKTKSQT